MKKRKNSKLISNADLTRYHNHLSKRYGEDVSRETIRWIANERVNKRNPNADDIEKEAKKLSDQGIVNFYKGDTAKTVDRVVLYWILVMSIIEGIFIYAIWSR